MDKQFKQRIVDVLFAGGYPDYALALNGFSNVCRLCPSVCYPGRTDGDSISLRGDLSDDELSLLTRHEILHVLLKHNKRAGNRRHHLFNVAGDLELSNYYSGHDEQVLLQSKVLGGGYSVSNEDGKQFAGMTAEEIYDALVDEKQTEMNQQGGQHGGQQEGQQEGQQGGQQEGQQGGQQEGQQGGQQGGQQEGQAEQGASSESAPENEGGDNNGHALSREEVEDMLNQAYRECGDLSDVDQSCLVEQIAKAIRDGFGQLTPDQQIECRGSEVLASSGNSGLGGNNNGLLPIMPIPDAEVIKLKYSLKKYFISQQGVDKGRSYKRPNKKYAESSFIMKTRTNVYKPTKTLAVYVDISGSMSKVLLERAVGVVNGVKKMKRVNVISHYFNRQIQDEFRPGGGTDYQKIFEHARENKYTAIAIVTDNSTSRFDADFEVDALWIIGVEERRNDNDDGYSISHLVTSKKKCITAKHFDIAIIPPKSIS